jgi:hypothetical protein
LVNHTNNSLIHFKNNTSSNSDLFKLFKEGFNKNSKMEFNSSWSRACISINVFNSDSLRNELDDFYKSVNFINFNYINKLLWEEFSDSGVNFG